MGGMAEILLARVRQPATPERLVVLKRMHRQLAVDREYVQMFLDEARIATTLRHPNVVEVYEIGEDNGQYFIAMEHLHGHDLRRVLSEMATRQVPMRLGQALGIARGICRGLEYTHERTDADGVLLGIVHRDVSPHNVVLTYNGHVKLVDFGIAKAATQISKTRTGIVKGKVAYMSPEQAMGDTLDRRSDVFCLGIMLWEMTTGRRLYRRKSELETLKAVVENDAPRPSLAIPAYPLELERIVMKALARERELRWATAGQVGEALTAFAKRRRLDLAPSTLASLMTATFSDEVAAWQDARRAGSSLGDHLLAGLDRDPGTSEPRDLPAVPDEEPELEDLPTTVVAPNLRRGSPRDSRPTPSEEVPASAAAAAAAAEEVPAAAPPRPARRSARPTWTPAIRGALRSHAWWIAAACAALVVLGLLVVIMTSNEAAPATPAPRAVQEAPASTARTIPSPPPLPTTAPPGQSGLLGAPPQATPPVVGPAHGAAPPSGSGAASSRHDDGATPPASGPKTRPVSPRPRPAISPRPTAPRGDATTPAPSDPATALPGDRAAPATDRPTATPDRPTATPDRPTAAPDRPTPPAPSPAQPAPAADRPAPAADRPAPGATGEPHVKPGDAPPAPTQTPATP